MTRAVLTVERRLSAITDAVVTLSPGQREDITERFRVASGEKTRVIPLGFDFARFDDLDQYRGAFRRELGLERVPIISVIGRLTAIKDHPFLFRAFAQLQRKDAHLCVVGGGEGAQELKRLASELGIAGRTHLLGFRTDLHRILADTDVVALSSLNEGTPVALIEALAAGCSIVSLDVGGVRDVLDGGRWGRLVPARSPALFATALAEVLAGPSSTSSIDARRLHARMTYGVERLVRDHCSLYEELLSRAVPAL
jgi:glycosyltransferase involved in cell wall biosynthesis